MSKYSIESTTLTDIGDAIRAKGGTSELIPVNGLAAAITALPTGGGGGDLPEEALVLTYLCNYRFAYGGWDWFLEAYGNQITTVDVLQVNNMFNGSTVTNIPFTINLAPSATVTSFFNKAESLVYAPTVIGTTPSTIGGIDDIFANCYNLKEIDYDFFNNLFTPEGWALVQSNTYARDSIFSYCQSLKVHPDIRPLINKAVSSSSALYAYLFNDCRSLSEVVNLPVSQAALTSNTFRNTFQYCMRCKNVLFEMEDSTTPKTANWKSQTIDLTSYFGYASSSSVISQTNSGITAEKLVTDAASYAVLKNDPDWWTSDINYCRYNHTSAVATIKSLPDCSASGGTNTIKMKGASGTNTDGGAISNLTSAEIAVATAKGWTVTLS